MSISLQGSLFPLGPTISSYLSEIDRFIYLHSISTLSTNSGFPTTRAFSPTGLHFQQTSLSFGVVAMEINSGHAHVDDHVDLCTPVQVQNGINLSEQYLAEKAADRWTEEYVPCRW